MVINRSPLQQDNGNLPLTFFGIDLPNFLLYNIY